MLLPLAVLAILATGTSNLDTATASDPAASPAAVTVPATRNELDSTHIDRALLRMRPDHQLRIRGEFGEMGRVGEFNGFVARAERTGLAGLRPSRDEERNAAPREITWDRIDRIDRRGNNARHGAIMGAVVVGIPATILGVAAGAFANTVREGGPQGGGPVVVGGLIGLAGGGVLGGTVGGLLGWATPRWLPVYARQP